MTINKLTYYPNDGRLDTEQLLDKTITISENNDYAIGNADKFCLQFVYSDDTSGETAYIQPDGTLSNTFSEFPAGRYISDTELRITKNP